MFQYTRWWDNTHHTPIEWNRRLRLYSRKKNMNVFKQMFRKFRFRLVLLDKLVAAINQFVFNLPKTPALLSWKAINLSWASLLNQSRRLETNHSKWCDSILSLQFSRWTKRPLIRCQLISFFDDFVSLPLLLFIQSPLFDLLLSLFKFFLKFLFLISKLGMYDTRMVVVPVAVIISMDFCFPNCHSNTILVTFEAIFFVPTKKQHKF